MYQVSLSFRVLQGYGARVATFTQRLKVGVQVSSSSLYGTSAGFCAMLLNTVSNFDCCGKRAAKAREVSGIFSVSHAQTTHHLCRWRLRVGNG